MCVCVCFLPTLFSLSVKAVFFASQEQPHKLCNSSPWRISLMSTRGFLPSTLDLEHTSLSLSLLPVLVIFVVPCSCQKFETLSSPGPSPEKCIFPAVARGLNCGRSGADSAVLMSEASVCVSAQIVQVTNCPEHSQL